MTSPLRIPSQSVALVDDSGKPTRDLYNFMTGVQRQITADKTSTATSSRAIAVPLFIPYPEDGLAANLIALPVAMTVTKVTSVTAADTTTATISINGTTLPPITVTTSQTDTAAAGTVQAGGYLSVTLSGTGAACTGLSLTISGTYQLG